ncbi:MAG TPA: Uma2 family endonuclease [Polyangia bacterium]
MSDLSILAVRRFRRGEYDRLVDLGLFQDERIELIDGLLVEMSPQGARHAYAVRQLTMLFARAVGERALVQIQSPLALGDDSEPEPDVALVPPGDYSRAHPSHAFLVVEVADDSLRKDRLVKARLYARAGIPEYWIVNLPQRTVEVHRGAGADGYSSVSTHGADQTVSPEAFADLEIQISAIIPATT